MAPNDLSRRDQLLVAFLSFLNDRSVDYCVLSPIRAENPDHDLDVDLSMSPEAFRAVPALVREFAETHDLLLLFDIWSGIRSRACTLVLRGTSARVVLKLDFMAGYGSRTLGEVFRHEDLARDKIFDGVCWRLSEESELAYLAARHVIKGDGRSYRQQRVAQLWQRVDRDAFARRRPAVIRDAVELVASADPSPADERIRALRARLRDYGRRRMGWGDRIAAPATEAARRLHRCVRPVGLSVAFLGPDGSGKSTLIQALRERLDPVFHGVSVLYWRPRLLPTPGRLKVWNPTSEKTENPDPHGVVPHGRLVSLVRMAYFGLDYVVGYPAVVVPKMVRKHLVIFDRFLHDVRVDPRRYRMQLPAGALALLERVAPKPDLIFVLQGTPEVLRQRKQELSLSEIGRQLGALGELAKAGPRFVPIDVDRDVETIVDEIVDHVIAARAEGARRSPEAADHG